MATNDNDAGSAGQTTALWGGWRVGAHPLTGTIGLWEPDGIGFRHLTDAEAAMLRALAAERDAANANVQALADALRAVAGELESAQITFHAAVHDLTEPHGLYGAELVADAKACTAANCSIWLTALNDGRIALAAADGAGGQG